MCMYLRLEAPPLEENQRTCWVTCGHGVFVGLRCSDALYCLDLGFEAAAVCVSVQIHTWLQEHEEMINSSNSWMSEAQSWLSAPCTYTTAKCLSSHVCALQVSRCLCSVLLGAPTVMQSTAVRLALLTYDVKIALQTVLDDSAQIRTTLQGFGSVLKEMSQVCDVAALQEQLVEADRQVASVQGSFTAPLSQLEHAAAVSRPSLNSFIIVALQRLTVFCR